LGQLVTGKLADHLAKKSMLFWGMVLQGATIIAMAFAETFTQFVFLSILLGLGTALVYPTFLAAIGDFTHPSQRAESIGIFRLWRDLGYAIGAILTGIIADAAGLVPSVLTVGIITIFSGFIILIRMTGITRPNEK
jgi:MFS family permease